ncbi:hypothetical protein FRB93_007527 [Tulasnella sp. JGI-2019a]|nr:hypothetical protein FRB93_007527 [Tulasnella sp. JGI-2019a]
MTTGTSSSSRMGTSPQPPRPYLNRVFDGPAGRILCVADIRGQHSQLNRLAKETNARAIIHTGDFGFFETASLERINDRTLRHLLLYSPLIPADQRDILYPKDATPDALRTAIRASESALKPHLSEFPLLLAGKLKLDVPVYTVWGACEDVAILEKFRVGDYDVENLHIIDEATSRTLEIGGIKLRLLGLGGAFVPHKLFDNGEGAATIAGGSGTMWTTALQIGELVDTAQRTFDQTETRLFVTHASPGREGLLAQLALVLKADLTVSAALHFRYASSWNEFSVQSDSDAYRSKLSAGKDSFSKIWDSVKSQVESVMDENQKLLLEKTFMVSERVPAAATVTTGATNEEPAWKNTWNWNLCDASFGHLVLDIREGRISAELKSQGFNYGYRRAPPSTTTGGHTATSTPGAVAKMLPPSASSPVSQQVATPPQPPSQQGADKPVVPNGALVPFQAPTKAPTPTKPAPPAKSSPQPTVNGLNGVGTTNTSLVLSPQSPVADIGTRSTASPAPSGDHKNRKMTPAEKREKKKERNASEAENANANDPNKPASPTPGSNAAGTGKHSKKGSKASGGVASPVSAPSPAPASDGRQDSNRPLTGGSSGARSPPPQPRTPGFAGSRRHPWTLYLSRLPVPVSEQEVKDCFGDLKDSITLVKLPSSGPGRGQKPIAFVEFKDEESMQSALAKSTKTIKDQMINMSIADNRERAPTDDLSAPTSANSNGPADGASNNNFQNQQNGGNFSRGGGHMSSRGSFRGRGGGRGGANLFAQAQRGLGQGSGRGMGMRKSSLEGGSANGMTSPSPGPAV